MTISCCWDIDHSCAFASVEHAPNRLLATGNLTWPVGYSTAISKVLDGAGISNFIWGDLLNAFRGSDYVPLACGFIVPTNKFDDAVSAITTAGLSPCPCETFFHKSNRDSLVSLPVHFVVPDPIFTQTVYLVPSDLFLDLIPFSSSHSNPAHLKYDEMRFNFRDTESHREGKEDDEHSLKVLTLHSIIKILLLLCVFSRPTQRGFVYTFEFTFFVLYHLREEGICDDLQSRSLEVLMKTLSQGLNASDRIPKAKERVKREWSGRILGQTQMAKE